MDNWHILSKVCSENEHTIDENIVNKVHNMVIKSNCRDYNNKLKIIAAALDTVQSDKCTISVATEVWLKVLLDFNDKKKSLFERRHWACQKKI